MKNLTGKPSDGDLKEGLCTPPAVAHRHRDVWVMDGSLPDDDLNPDLLRRDAYSQYVFLGRIPVAGCTRHEARTIARTKFHPEARVFATARYFVAYRVL